MRVSPDARSWFERAVFDLAIAKAHLQSQLWSEAGQYSRQAALKFLQSALVQTGHLEPAPRMNDLLAEVRERYPTLETGDDWDILDRFVSARETSKEEAVQAYAISEAVRDEIARLLG